jgi:hypothetical protein
VRSPAAVLIAPGLTDIAVEPVATDAYVAQALGGRNANGVGLAPLPLGPDCLDPDAVEEDTGTAQVLDRELQDSRLGQAEVQGDLPVGARGELGTFHRTLGQDAAGRLGHHQPQER